MTFISFPSVSHFPITYSHVTAFSIHQMEDSLPSHWWLWCTNLFTSYCVAAPIVQCMKNLWRTVMGDACLMSAKLFARQNKNWGYYAQKQGRARMLMRPVKTWRTHRWGEQQQRLIKLSWEGVCNWGQSKTKMETTHSHLKMWRLTSQRRTGCLGSVELGNTGPHQIFN